MSKNCQSSAFSILKWFKYESCIIPSGIVVREKYVSTHENYPTQIGVRHKGRREKISSLPPHVNFLASGNFYVHLHILLILLTLRKMGNFSLSKRYKTLLDCYGLENRNSIRWGLGHNSEVMLTAV